MDRARALSSCVLATLLVTASTGCKGALGQVAAAGAVAAITAVQIAAMKSRSETSPQNVATYGPAPANGISPCGRCPEPENGYAICFVSTCEARCIEGYVLEGAECVPVAAPSASR